MSQTENNFNISQNELDSFRNDGFVIFKNFWPEDLLSEWEKTIIVFYYLQALKLNHLRKKFSKGNDPTLYNTVEDFDKVLQILEEEDKEAGYHASVMIENSVAQRKLFTHEPFVNLCAQLLDCNISLLNFSAGTPFPNLPKAKRLLYRWHSEASYYPKRKNFLNVWFPMFRDKYEKNGTMVMAKGSHKNPYWDFVEYKYDQGRTQFEIVEDEIKDYEKIVVEAKRKDLVIFDRNLVHSSTTNESNEISYTTVLRVVEMRKDLTLSSLMEARPYSEGMGRPGLVPIV